MTKQTGGCLCGNIRFEVSGAPGIQVVCHCRMCQRASGAAFMGLIFFEAADVKLTGETPKVYQGSETLLRHFCPDCGSPVYVERSSTNRLGILAGAMDDPGAFQPTMHICTSSSQTWLKLADALPSYAEKPPGMSATVTYDVTTGKAKEAS